MQGLFISGSGTDVGKTFIAIRIIKALSNRFKVVARKPIESDCQQTADGLHPKDAVLLNKACTNPEAIEAVCKFPLSARASAEKASTEQGLKITLNDLLSATQPNDENDFVIVEGAGGLYSPIAKNTLNSDFAKALGLPMVLVVKDELSAINQALLSLRAAKEQNLEVKMLVLNQITPNNLGNAKALNAYTDVAVVVFNQACEDAFAQKLLMLLSD